MRTVIAFALTEFRRKRIIFWAILLTVVYLGLFAWGIRYGDHMGPGEVMPPLLRPLIAAHLTTAGLYGSSFLVNLLALFLGVGAVSAEIESGTLHAVLSKPIRREAWLLGKWLGLALALAAYATVMWAAILLLVSQYFGMAWNWSLAGWLEVIAQPTLLLTLAMAGSTSLSTLANGVCMVMLYGLSVIGGLIEQIGAIAQVPSLVQMGIISSLLLPVDSLYRAMIRTVVEPALGPLAQGLHVSPFAVRSAPSAWMMAYAAVYGILALLAGMRHFARRDL